LVKCKEPLDRDAAAAVADGMRVFAMAVAKIPCSPNGAALLAAASSCSLLILKYKSYQTRRNE